MKRFLSILLSLCLLTLSVACTSGNDAPHTEANESGESSSPISEEEKETEAAPEENKTLTWKEVGGMKYLDISSMGIPAGKDASSLFLTEFEGEAVEGYYIEEGVYSVDAETMNRIVKMPFKGNGAIRYLKYYAETYGDPEANFDGILHISRMNDPLYVITCLPNEQSSYMESVRGRMNASVLVDPAARHDKVLPIGAVYLNDSIDIPDDASFTVCIGKMTCAVKWQGEDWEEVYGGLPHPPSTLYYLPWQLEGELGTKGIDTSKVQVVEDRVNGDHLEISITAADLKNGGSSDPRIDGMTLHFWGEENYFFQNAGKTGADLEGVATSYVIWIKEPEYSGYLTCDIGADLRDANNKVDQAFTGISCAVTSEPRVIYGHNVATEEYDAVMQSRDLQDILGISD